MTLLLVFSLFTTAEMKKFIIVAQREKGFEAYREKKRTTENLKEKAYLQKFKAESHQKQDLVVERKKTKTQKPYVKKSYKLNFDLNRPPDNAYFNLNAFLFEEDNNSLITRKEIFERLLQRLYGSYPFYQKIPHFEKIITNRFLEEKDKFEQAVFAEELFSLTFEEANMREAFYLMLKGSDEYPSLLNYVHFRSLPGNKKINLLFAPPELILSLFDDPKAAFEIISLRDDVFSRMTLADTPLTRASIREELSQKTVQILMNNNLEASEYKKLFDFYVGKPGSVLYIIDPLTKKKIREKLFQKIHNE